MTTNELIALLVRADPTGKLLVLVQTPEDGGDLYVPILDVGWFQHPGQEKRILINWMDEEDKRSPELEPMEIQTIKKLFAHTNEPLNVFTLEGLVRKFLKHNFASWELEEWGIK